jgi:hypothetical protein
MSGSESMAGKEKKMTVNKKCMVCISTRQNTANLVPFLQFNLDTMVILETDYSKSQGWGAGLKKVLREKGKKVKQYSLGHGTDLNQMLAYIREVVNGLSPVCWNIGGGQKMQQMALMKVFQERLNVGGLDWACYADPGTRKIYIIKGDRHNLTSQESEIRTDIRLDDVLTIFHLEKREKNDPLLLWNSSSPDVVPADDIFRDMTPFWNDEDRQDLLTWVMNETGEEPKILQGLKHGYADYFEQIVQYEIAQILKKNAGKHHVTEAWANVRVKDSTGKEIAEWDIVLVTDFGTLVILDAKTGIFHSKDEDARLFNLERATGIYGEFWLIIPYFFEDMKNDGFYAHLGNKGKEYRSIPFTLNELHSRFLAVGAETATQYLTKIKKKKVRYSLSLEKPECLDNTLTIESHQSLLSKLNLLRRTT